MPYFLAKNNAETHQIEYILSQAGLSEYYDVCNRLYTIYAPIHDAIDCEYDNAGRALLRVACQASNNKHKLPDTFYQCLKEQFTTRFYNVRLSTGEMWNPLQQALINKDNVTIWKSTNPIVTNELLWSWMNHVLQEKHTGIR
jgi:hypothetical protein